jgi:hypothetical protein
MPHAGWLTPAHPAVNECLGKSAYPQGREKGFRVRMEQRAAFRFPTNLAADCRSCGRTWSSRLNNISTTGCMIVCPEPPLPDGALLRLRLPGLTAIDGKIVWQNRGHAGVRFVAPLHEAVMVYLGFHDPVQEATPAPADDTADEPRRAAGGLHGQLVKRTWLADPTELRASNG